ncbi:MAG: alpha-amylase [Lachnospiraceae bacterium]|nr:alpha-amylase [Lachnospiraceae bacterium]
MRKIFKKVCSIILISSLSVTILAGCGGDEKKPEETTTVDISTLTPEEYYNVLSWKDEEFELSTEDHYRNYYEVFVYSYADSNGDGIGDINGLISKLDYIEDMGFNGIWLMPVMPSTTYHKYDVIDYYDIDEEYGTMDDFKNLVEECHKRNINIIIDLVFNHTSSQHEWFKTARDYYKSLDAGQEPDFEECPEADYYNFKKEEDIKTPNAYTKVAGTEYFYESQFWSGMPDLNLKSEAVRHEIEKIVDFWIEIGVDGFRLDAAKEYFSGGTDANVEVLDWFCSYVKSVREDAYIVAEVWDSQATIANYYKSGIESIFDYAFGNYSGILVKSINQMNGQWFAKCLESGENKYYESNSEMVNAPFASNHDTGRIPGFVSNDENKVKFAGALNQLMSGCSFAYYGEEIGMTGSVSAKDENARAPMNWSNFSGGVTTVGPPAMDEIEHRFPSAEEQLKDKNSILWYYKQMLHIRSTYEEIARGKTTAIEVSEDTAIAGIKKTYNDKEMIILCNFGIEEKTVTLSKDTYGYEALVATLVTSTDYEVKIDGETITLPPYGIAFLK